MQAIESVGKIEFHDNMVSWQCLKVPTSRVDGSLTATWNTNSQLARVKTSFSWFVPKVLAHLDTSRLRVKPTAMGRTLPDFY